MIATNAVVMGASVIVYNRVAAPGNAYLDDDERMDTDTDGASW